MTQESRDFAAFVVTFSATKPESPAFAWEVSKLRRMSLEDARGTLALADRIPKHGHIVNADTLEFVA